MSDKDLDDTIGKVVIGNDDCDTIKKYYEHFDVEFSEELEKALEKFKKENTFENQQDVKLALCKSILLSQDESFNDPLWDAPKKASKEIVFDLQFDKDLKEELEKSDENKGE
jgi:hypothetical protein